MNANIRLKDEKQRRQTLNVNSFLSTSRIKPVSIPNSARLISFSPEEIEQIGWLKTISKGSTCDYRPPPTIHPNEAKITKRLSEMELTERQPDSDISFTAESFYNDMSTHNLEVSYKSIPLREIESLSKIKSFNYTFSKCYDEIKFLQVKSYHLNGKSGVGASSGVKVFSWNDCPTCEPVYIDFSQQTTLCSTYGQLHKDFFVPYVQSENSRFVAVLYSLETFDKGVVEKPIALGHIKYSEIESEGSISLNWVVFDSEKTLNQHFVSDKTFPMFDLVFDVLPGAEVPKCEHPNQYFARLTPINPVYPSSLLTFYNLRIDMKADKLSRGAQMFCKITIKTDEEQPKTLNLAAKANGSILVNSYRTSNIALNDVNYFPEEYNFKLDPILDVNNLQATIEIFLYENKKEKLICDAVVPLTKPRDTFSAKLKKRGLFGSVSAHITVSYLYPSVIQPPCSLKKFMTINKAHADLKELPDFTHPMFQDIAPYLLQLLFDAEIIKVVDFNQLATIISKCGKDWIYSWIEHSFYCSPEFPLAYIKRLGENCSIIGTNPLIFLLILFKSLVTVRKTYISEIAELLKLIAKDSNVQTKIAAAKFICQTRMFFDNTILGKPTYIFISLLNNHDRLCVFQVLFSDPAVIQTIVPPFCNEMQGVYSPYIPLISLFLSTVHQSFLANNKQAIEPAITSIRILACSCESYTEGDTAAIIAFNFFPLLTLIFTFYDSLIPHIETINVLVPFILFIFQNNNIEQFKGYYNLLSDYNKLRFLDLCASISDSSTIKCLSKGIEGINGNELAISYEITWRLMLFLKFIESIDVIQDVQLKSIFKIIFHMLSPQQDAEAFPLVFASLAFIVSKFQVNIFSDETNHIMFIMSSVVPLTQRKTAAARVTALAFMRYLVSLEGSRMKKGEKEFRCFISVMFAFVKCLFENDHFEFKASTIDEHYDRIDNKIDSLKMAYNASPIYFKCVMEMLDAYKGVKAVKGAAFLTYKKMVEINARNNDFCAAFICQWRLCAIIAQVFMLSNKVPDGIPKEGAAVFPFIPQEFLDKEKDTNNFQYLLLEGEMFNEQSISNELETALVYCRKAGLHWLAGSITEILLNFLESHRQFDELQNIFSVISQSYTVLAQTDKPALEFYLVQFSGPIAKSLKLSTCIQVLSYIEDPSGSGENLSLKGYKDMLLKGDPSITFVPESKELLFSNKDAPKNQSLCQIVKVEYDEKELTVLNAKTFSKEFVQKEGGWYEENAVRYVFTTDSPLPGPCSIVKAEPKCKNIITRKDLYFDTLSKFSNELSEKVNEFRVVMPPSKLATAWTKWSLGLNTDELIKLVKQCLDDDPNDETTIKRAPLIFVKKYKLLQGNRDALLDGLNPDDKKTMLLFINQVWNKMVDAIKVIDDLFMLNNRDRQNGLNGDPMVQKYRDILIQQKKEIKDLV